MINILYNDFPESIFADDKEYKIYTDFRNWIQFSELLASEELRKEDKICVISELICEPVELITEEIVTEIFKFYEAKEIEYIACNENESEQSECNERPPVFDWCIDARYILGDFRRFYNINLRTANLHWWEFKSLFLALPDDSCCKKRIVYRSVNLSEIKNVDERTRIKKIQQQIALPFTYSDEAIAAELGGFM